MSYVKTDFSYVMVYTEWNISGRTGMYWYFLTYMLMLNLSSPRWRHLRQQAVLSYNAAGKTLRFPQPRPQCMGVWAATITYYCDEVIHCGRVPR
eukprot:7084308-Pyramimonas_sp.AAC.1